MIKKLLLLTVLITGCQAYSQEFYLLTGSNFTKYNFETRFGSMATQLQSGTGSSYEMGYSTPFGGSHFSYSFAATLNAYNAVAGSAANSYQWETQYLGGQGAFTYTCPLSKSFSVSAKLGTNLSTIIYGKQNSNGAIYDITSQKEFKGVLLSTFVGIHSNYKFSNSGYLSFGYGYSNGTNISNNSTEKLNFRTNQLLFGIHYKINN